MSNENKVEKVLMKKGNVTLLDLNQYIEKSAATEGSPKVSKTFLERQYQTKGDRKMADDIIRQMEHQ